MSTLRVDTIQNAAGNDSPISVPGTAKAWVNFNGNGTVAIRESYNVSSITDNGAGDYTVNFTTALEDANYSATFGMGLNNTTSVVVFGNDFSFTRTASTMRTHVRNHTANALIDWGALQVAVFR
jgi:hypothetical protein